jgi:hypothetical protein
MGNIMLHVKIKAGNTGQSEDIFVVSFIITNLQECLATKESEN